MTYSPENSLKRKQTLNVSKFLQTFLLFRECAAHFMCIFSYYVDKLFQNEIQEDKLVLKSETITVNICGYLALHQYAFLVPSEAITNICGCPALHQYAFWNMGYSHPTVDKTSTLSHSTNECLLPTSSIYYPDKTLSHSIDEYLLITSSTSSISMEYWQDAGAIDLMSSNNAQHRCSDQDLTGLYLQ